jgi:glutamate dehydrogenase/leucine dehydrogenase
MDLAQLAEYDGHELVVSFREPACGLRGFIGIHSTRLGPATGGTRYVSYASERDALRDALRLSRAMTSKCALAGVPYGGGKAVIMRDPKKPKSVALLRAYANVVNSLGGNYTTGEDVGIDMHDIRILHKRSKFINGVRGDLGPWAARGVFEAMCAALRAVYGTSSFRGRTLAVKGLGKVGLGLCQLAAAAGAKRIVAGDVSPDAVRAAKKLLPQLVIVRPEAVIRERADVFAPCALSGDLAMRSIRKLRAGIVCGGANNQLATPADGARLHKAGIVYVPDYLANAGGLIAIVGEMRKGKYNKAWVERKVCGIGRTTAKVLALSAKRRKPLVDVADTIVRDRLSKTKARSR